jgi:diguanylate cyclase (GGDEF)-like protein
MGEMAVEGQEGEGDGELARLRDRVALLEAVIANFPGGIVVTDPNLEVVLCNDRQRRMLDYPDTLFASGKPTLRELFHLNAGRGEYGPGRIDDLVRRKLDLVRQGIAHVFERTRPNGTVLEIRGEPLKGGGFVTTYLDVTEQRRDQAMIAHLAHHDALTGLPNRALLYDRVGQSIARLKRGEKFALHYIDLDRFKPVNDRHGHATGDRLLVEVAVRLKKAAREMDTVARFGGDEFIVVQANIGEAKHAASLARRMVGALAKPFEFDGRRCDVGASIGIALAPGDGEDRDELLRKADAALYRCKTEGGRGFRFHSTAPGALAAVS